MPRSSRHKSHRHSKHSSRDTREYSESEEDAKIRDFNKEEDSARVTRNSGSSDKLKHLPGHTNGDVEEEYLSSKRMKEKERDREKSSVREVSDRWNGGGGSGAVIEGEVKGESSKSKNGEKREESKSGGKAESKQKYEKEPERKEVQQSKGSKESKEKAKVFEKEKERERERERKLKDSEREVEDELVDIGDAVTPLVGFDKEQEGRHVWPIQDKRITESEKKLEKRRKRDGSYERDKYQDDVKGSGDRRVSSRGECAKDVKYKDEKHKDGSHDDKYREDGDRDARYRDEKYAEDVDRERRYRDAQYRESSEKVNRHKEDRYREDADRDKRLRDDKYREDGDRDYRHRDAKYRKDSDKDYRRRVDKYREDGDRDDRHRDDWYYEDSYRDARTRDEKNWEDAGRDGRRREGKHRDDSIKDKRVHDVKYQDEWLVRDGINDNSDLQRSRDESEAAEFAYKRLNNSDGSPNFDDRGIRYKDDRGKRRTSDKEEYDDTRIWNSKEQPLDRERKSDSSARVESVGNRGRSILHDADVVISPNQGRRGNSPSYRVLKQEESRYRDYPHGGRERHAMTPSKEYTGVHAVSEKVSRPNERSIQKEDEFGDDTSTERRPREDAPMSSVHRVDRSPSSASNGCRNLKRADVRRSLDIEDLDQRSGSSKEVNEYRGRDNRGNSGLPSENLPGNEIPLADNDNVSTSSPFSKPNHFNNSNRPLLPSTPFRGGPDRPFDDENRGRQNRRRRMDSNVGRVKGNAWRGMPSWPSPASGFVPFQHGPPPLGFHPVMQQFPNSIFGVRPSMELNQSGVPFHGHVRPLGWDGNNSPFVDESHLYGRLDWDHNRNLISGSGWENSRDAWKGQNSGVNAELLNMSQKVDPSARGPGDEDWPRKLTLPVQVDKKQLSVQVDSIGNEHSSDVEMDSPKEASKAIPDDISDLKTKDDNFSCAYLSMLDISEDLSQYEVYSQCTNLVGLDCSTDPDGDDSRLVIMEEDIDALGKDSNKTSSVSLFSTMNNSVFQKAMSLYKKLKEEAMPLRQDKGPSTNDDQSMEVTPTYEEEEPELSVSSKVKTEAKFEITSDKADQVMTDPEENTAEPNASLKEVKMEITDEVDNNGNKGKNLSDGKFVPLPFSGASEEVVGIEGVNESGSVILSRRLQSPESTH